MKICILTANLGGFEQKIVENAPQTIKHDFFRVVDKDFPPRKNSMTPRLQARIVKCFGWQMYPGYDIYIWHDSSVYLSHPQSVQWLLAQLGDADIAVLKHPTRKTVQEEADYLKYRLSIKCPYITPRYENELIDEQLKVIDPTAPLYASTVFIYRPTAYTRVALKEWWHHTSRFHSIDQLSLPHAIEGLEVNVIDEDYHNSPYIKYARK